MGPRHTLSFCAWKSARFARELQVSAAPRPDLSFYARKTACLASELLVSAGPNPHLLFLDAKQRLLDHINKSQTSPAVLCLKNDAISTWITSLYVSQPSSVGFGCKSASFGPEQQVSTGPRYHLSFCAWKTSWLAQESLVSMCLSCFCMQNSDFWSRITSLYGYRTSPVVLCMQNRVIRTRITYL